MGGVAPFGEKTFEGASDVRREVAETPEEALAHFGGGLVGRRRIVADIRAKHLDGVPVIANLAEKRFAGEAALENPGRNEAARKYVFDEHKERFIGAKTEGDLVKDVGGDAAFAGCENGDHAVGGLEVALGLGGVQTIGGRVEAGDETLASHQVAEELDYGSVGFSIAVRVIDEVHLSDDTGLRLGGVESCVDR
jgi:hypothetical protein